MEAARALTALLFAANCYRRMGKCTILDAAAARNWPVHCRNVAFWRKPEVFQRVRLGLRADPLEKGHLRQLLPFVPPLAAYELVDSQRLNSIDLYMA